MNVLVTGGAGYIGSHTVVELQKAGHHVVIVDDLSNAKASVIDKIERITGIRPAFYPINCADLAQPVDILLRAVSFTCFEGDRYRYMIHAAASGIISKTNVF